MILFDYNFLNDQEIEYVLSLWKKDLIQKHRPNGPIYFDGIYLKERGLDLKLLKDNLFDVNKFTSVRLQRYNENIEQVNLFHGHKDIYNYVIFLNENFQGGELEFETGVIVKPTKGTLVYFNNNERHKVHNCIGDKFSLVFAGNNKIPIEPHLSLRIRKNTII